MKYVIGFGRFWYDFIVGDSVLLAIGTPLAILAAFALYSAGFEVGAELALPAIVTATLVLSLRTR